ncbi:MAG: sulfatase [Cytophagales bacterium]|uniref:sulfatase family protein n=1 Tax=Cyclobacterium marinum TaxID=104 RepID=UPI0030D99FD9|nr:sulfatase [Cytophagales bacterium]|tara:strand:+ start:60230 stop:61741 length:1512 start_codon:yes stop_codon:yes gene_type:complete
MSVKQLHVNLVAAVLLCGVALGCSPKGTQNVKPNILLIVSEDNSSDLGSYGNTLVHTPNIDKLAKKGVKFLNAYTTYSVCSPSRSSIFTGLYPHQNGQLGWATHHYGLYSGITVLPNYLKETGYRTGILGKIHVNPAERFDFDYEALSGSNFQKESLKDYAIKAKEFVNQSDSPFFLKVNFPDAHLPFQNEVEGLPTIKVNRDRIKETLPFVGVNNERLLDETEAYYNCMNRLDESIGMLLDSLGDLSNTCIIYLSDHGAQFSRGKLTNYEGGLKIPFIISYPEVIDEIGSSRDELISVIDILPTVLDLSDTPLDVDLPGKSLMDLFTKEDYEINWRTTLGADGEGASPVFYYPRRSIRNKRYKLIRNIDVGRGDFPAFTAYASPDFGSGASVEEIERSNEKVRDAYETWRKPPEWELYDLQNDPWEFENLAGKPEFAEVLISMKEALYEWRVDTNDPFLSKDKLMKFTFEMDSVNALYPDHSYREVDGFKWKYLDYLKNESS